MKRHGQARGGAALVCATALLGLAGALAPAAASAALPAVSTGGAIAVSFGSATLTGSLNPKGSDTSYYFQYGPTKLYGLQTGILDAGSGVKTLHVSIALGGLQPLTVYHFRLVAVNGSGPALGADRSLLTTKVPLSLAILASPNPVPFGGTVTIQGTLSGTGNGNREVVLQASPFPYSAGFANVGNPELTTAQGGFSFPVLGLTLNTQYRVLTSTNPPVVSPVASESVALRISPHAHRLRARIVHGKRLVRFYGTVAPAMDKAEVGILRLVHGRNIFIAGMVLRHSSATSSHFQRTVRVGRGIYRILVLTKTPALVSTYSAPLFVR